MTAKPARLGQRDRVHEGGQSGALALDTRLPTPFLDDDGRNRQGDLLYTSGGAFAG